MSITSTRGNSLSEVLMALWASSLMLLVMGSSYVSIKNHYLWQAAKLSETQESLLLVNWFKKQIHAAGVLGCRTMKGLKVTGFSPQNGLTVLEASDPQLPKAIRRTAVKGSQVLLIRKLAAAPRAILQAEQYSKLLTLLEPTQLKKGMTISISDCEYVTQSVVQSISPSKLKLTLKEPLPRTFTAQASLGELIEMIIYIRNTEEGAALFVSEKGRSEALVSKVTQLIVTKKNRNERALIYVKLQRTKAPPLSFYAATYAS